jgi:outer membrane murein-binding lipoprotein Lpp
MDWLGVDLRRMGTALLVFGIVGMVVAGIVAAGLIGGAIAARNLDDRLAAERVRLVRTLDRVDSAMAQTATTIDNAGATLATTSETLASASSVLGQVAATSEDLSTSLDFSILGSQPLAGTAQKFGELAVQVRGFGAKAQALSDDLAVNAGDTGALATEIDGLRDELARLTARIDSFEATGELVGLLVGGILLLGLLVAWLAVAGAGCAWFGLRLRRLGTTVVALPTAGP